MKAFLKFFAYLFHPLFMPILGSGLYYWVSPRYSPIEMQGTILIKIAILTICIPIILYYLLRNLGVVSSIFLEKLAERKIPLYANIILLLLILKIVLPESFAIELYWFFVAALATTTACLLLVFFKIKASIHMMGICSVTMFIMILSIHYQKNLLLMITTLIIGCGLVASSRLSTKSHNGLELILGSLLGVIPQIMVINYWM
ncbi:hypothetical protein ABN763_13290 [Spongiivirga sp. MCCC 1A20706]|uniref:hypothetical protein n=1 Tax=Spongiivirga sp. MCCC 1A20706 TaxID=3160963 RepID=UPI003977D725